MLTRPWKTTGQNGKKAGFWNLILKKPLIFLEKIFSFKKFSTTGISWIMGYIRSPKFSVFINGKPRGRIAASRGIPRGPPSPFLFLLVSEVLGEIISKLHSSGQFESFLVGKDMIHLSLLQFADDTLLFCKYNVKMLFKLKEAISGVNVEEDDLIQTANILD